MVSLLSVWLIILLDVENKKSDFNGPFVAITSHIQLVLGLMLMLYFFVRFRKRLDQRIALKNMWAHLKRATPYSQFYAAMFILSLVGSLLLGIGPMAIVPGLGIYLIRDGVYRTFTEWSYCRTLPDRHGFVLVLTAIIAICAYIHQDMG